MAKNTRLRAEARRIIEGAIMSTCVSREGIIIRGAEITRLSTHATMQALINLARDGITFSRVRRAKDPA